jgi:hypothetical protein
MSSATSKSKTNASCQASFDGHKHMIVSVVNREKNLVKHGCNMYTSLLESGKSKADALEETSAKLIDTGILKRCFKVKKDANAPKGAKSAYMFWCGDNRNTIKAENPAYKMTDVAKALGKKWKTVGTKTKVKYQKSADADRARYLKEKAVYTPADDLASFVHARNHTKMMLKHEKDLLATVCVKCDELIALGQSTTEAVLTLQTSHVLEPVKTIQVPKKDKDAPKQAKSAYMFWCAANRGAIQEKNPKYKMTDVAQALGTQWKSVTDEVKAEFKVHADADRERFQLEQEAYKNKAQLLTGGLDGVGASNASA